MFTVLQISDTHLSQRVPRFNANWAAAARALGGCAAELIVHTGDAALDGPDHAADLGFAATALRMGIGAAGPRLRCVPGNHDVGDRPEFAPHQPVTDARVAAHTRAFGAASWVEDVPGWRLIGINTQVLGSSTAAEAAQQAMLAEAALTLGDRRLALFMHKPPFLHQADESTLEYWTVPPADRARLTPLLEHPNLRLIASGHLHLQRLAFRGRVMHAWSPATSFVVGPRLMPDTHGGERRLGVLRHRFSQDAVATEAIDLPGAELIVLDPLIDELYPLPTGPEAAAR